jgi:2-keto-4-pentenoate hydratase
MGSANTTAKAPPSFAAPFHHPAFAVIWTATLVSNIGGWLQRGIRLAHDQP